MKPIAVAVNVTGAPSQIDAVELVSDVDGIGFTIIAVAAAGGPWDRAFAVHVLVVTRDVD